MRICVVISNDDWRKSAGVRIRYDRIAPALAARGGSLELRAIDTLDGRQAFDADIYLFSKCHDIRTVLLARQMRASGKRVGIDFFDDYYSQSRDSGFVHLREWFREMIQVADFALCSTPNMRARLVELAPGLTCHVMNDPAGTWQTGELADILTRNLDRALTTRQADIGWFGIGDNPHFSLGLDDLNAFSPVLTRCRRAGFKPRLRILTNRRALTAERLSMISRLPVPTELEEWSEEREAALIADSLFCFLPVNGQGFSTVKSLNRAVSVLSGGAQVLSAGFPLYQQLDEFIYRDIGTLLSDVERRRLKFRRGTLDAFGRLMDRIGSAETEARELLAFLTQLPPPEKTAWPAGKTILVVHGHRSLGAVHKQVQRLRHLSVGTPFYPAKLHYDVAFNFATSGEWVDITVSKRALPHLKEEMRELAKPQGEAGDMRLRLRRKNVPDLYAIAWAGTPPRPATELARYRPDMELIGRLLALLFRQPELYRSELGSPFWLPGLEPNPSLTEAE